MTKEDNRLVPPSRKIDFRVFFMREKCGMEIIAIGYVEDWNGCIRCSCCLNPNTKHFFYTDPFAYGLINLGKKDKFVECRLASRHEVEFMFSTMRQLGFNWNKRTRLVDECEPLIRERRFNIMTDDDMFFDLDKPRFTNPQPEAFFWRNESV